MGGHGCGYGCVVAARVELADDGRCTRALSVRMGMVMGVERRSTLSRPQARA